MTLTPNGAMAPNATPGDRDGIVEFSTSALIPMLVPWVFHNASRSCRSNSL